LKTINDIVYNLIEETPIKRYLEKDSSLIVSKQVKDEFGLINDKIEFHIYDFNSEASLAGFAVSKDGALVALSL
jgi:hypothetical protein